MRSTFWNNMRPWLEEYIMADMGIGSPWNCYATDAVLVVVTILGALLSYNICKRIITPFAHSVAQKTATVWDDILFNKASLHRVCLLMPAMVLWVFIPQIFYRFPMVEATLEVVTNIYIVVTFTRLLLSLIKAAREKHDGASIKQQYFHSMCGALKFVVIFLASIVCLGILIDKNPMTLIAGLGATSAVLMVVFKDSIIGMVAGIRLTSNEMLKKGEWITVKNCGINGIVEDITITTVKVRNFDNTIVTISPLTLVNESFQNWRSMQEGAGRRVTRTIYIDTTSIKRMTADDIAKLNSLGYEMAVKEGEVNLTVMRRYMHDYIATHPDVNSDLLFMVRHLAATPTGLPIEFYFFLREKAWKAYEDLAANVLEEIYATIPDFGLKVYQRV